MNHQELAATVRNVLAHSYDEDALAALDSLEEQYENYAGYGEILEAKDSEIAGLKEQLEAANRALSWYEEHRDSEGNYDGLMFGPLDAISNPTSGERVAAGMPSSTSATAGASQSPEDSSPASSPPVNRDAGPTQSSADGGLE